MLRNSPGFTAVAVLTLALGIGANTAIFSVTDAILLRPLPYKHPSQLVFPMETNSQSAFGETEPSLADINDWRASSKTLQHIAAFDWQNYFLTGEHEPQLVWGLRVSPEFFSTLGVLPSLGRVFSPHEINERVAVISYGFWEERFGGDRGLIGRTIILNDNIYTVVGIMPAGFVFPPVSPIPGVTPEIFVPLAPTTEEASQRSVRAFDAIARMKPGVSVQECRAELSAVAANLQREYPATNKGWGVDLTSVDESAVGGMRVPLLILACSVTFVLLLACGNVVNLLLARNESRRREISIRAALGASASRIRRQLLTESALLAIASGALGVISAAWSLKMIVSAFPANIPRINEIRVDGTALAFSVLLASVTTILFGLLPALRASRPDVDSELKAGGGRFARSQFGTSGRLVVFQVAVSVILLTGAGLLIHSMARLLSNDIGFDPDGVLTARLELPPNRYRSPNSVEAFHDDVLKRVRLMPGVESAAMVMTLPLSGRSTLMYAEAQHNRPGLPAQPIAVEYNAVTPEYFATMRIPVIAGRGFSEADELHSADVAVVNEAMARNFWPQDSAIGKYFRFGATPWLQVVGVVKNEKYWSLSDRGKPEFYLPYSEASRFGATYLMRILTFLVVRSPLRPESLASEIRIAVWKVDANEPVVDIQTMKRLVADSVARMRFTTFLLSILAGIATWLAVTGLLGLLTYSVSQRTHEIGIRVALGAQRTSVLSMVIREGMLLTGAGLAIGFTAGLALTRFVRGLLFEVAPGDPITFVGVAIAFAIVALAACWVPAQRAMKVDPMVALRYE
jgi:putative ABC transport system permease protein